jgi:hypothetical protein
MACYPHNPQCSSGEPIHAKQIMLQGIDFRGVLLGA